MSARDHIRREAGEGTNLWRLISAPTLWAAHFLVVYPTAAVYCAKFGRGAELSPIRWFVAGATLLALGVFAWLFAAAWRVRGPSLTDDDLSFEANSPEERHRFLTHVTLALTALSAVATIYVALPVVFVETCR
jgi:hypothetical protein